MSGRPAGAAEGHRAARRLALEVVLPTPEETRLLRALLWQGDAGRAAFAAWQTSVLASLPTVNGPKRSSLPETVKAMLPMLHGTLRERAIEPERRLAAYCRAAHLREELRGNAYRRILEAVFDSVAAAGLEPLLIGGWGLAATVYPDPASRHSHAVRLLLPPTGITALAARLEALDFSAMRASERGPAAAFRHRSGLPLELWASALPPPHDALASADLLESSRKLEELHEAARIPAFEDAFLIACVKAAVSRDRQSLRWACDAWLILERQSGSFDWQRLLYRAERAAAALPLGVTLGCLARELGAAVPDQVVERLGEAARRADDVALEAALLLALRGSHVRMWRLIGSLPGFAARLAVLRPLVLPRPSAVRAIDGDRLPLPLAYALRPARYLAGALVRGKPPASPAPSGR